MGVGVCGGDSRVLFLLGVECVLAGVEIFILCFWGFSVLDGFLGGGGYLVDLSLVPPLFGVVGGWVLLLFSAFWCSVGGCGCFGEFFGGVLVGFGHV